MNSKVKVKEKFQISTIFYLAIVLFVSYFTYFRGYEYPNKLFWDENYHIASAYKYLDNTFFMEMHPPLGKLFIALGEKIYHPNDNLDLSSVKYKSKIKIIPKKFSFKGLRFFPALFAFLSAGLFFILTYLLIGNAHLSFLFSFFYLLDNALIVHSRGAMLDGMQIFFILLSLVYFTYLFSLKKQKSVTQYFLIGFLISIAASIKATSLILLICPFFMFCSDFTNFKENHGFISRSFYTELSLKILTFFSGFLLIILFSYFIHYSVASEVRDGKTYKVSKKFLELVETKQVAKILNLPITIKESVKYFLNYQKGVPTLKPGSEFENGSHPIFWPFGKKAINYRWEKVSQQKIKYLMLQINPIVWSCGFIGLLLSFVIFIGHFVFNIHWECRKTFSFISYFFISYVCYMVVMLRIDRVMYLYHYFIPLLFSLFLFFLSLKMLFLNSWKRYDRVLYFSITTLLISTLICYWYFSPMTYYKPINIAEFMSRNWFDIWQYRIIYY